MIELKQGQSTTIGILIADGYDMSNIDNVYLYINQTKFTPAIIDRMLRVEMSSKTTSVFIGTSNVRLIFDDKTFGRREYVLENIVWEATKARVYDDSVDLGYTVTYPITISETAIEAGDVMYDYVKGAAGSLSSVTASVDSNVGTPEVIVTYDGENADFAFKNLKGDKGEKGEQGEQGEQGEKGDDAVLPDNIVIDPNYVHTDNNYTNADKAKVAGALATSHTSLLDKNAELSFQHLDTTTEKTTPIDADSFGLWDSVTSTFKRLSVANMLTWFRGLPHTFTQMISFSGGVKTDTLTKINGSGSYVSEDGGTIWHTTKRFMPSGTFSSNGTTVTTTGGQLTSAMVGAKIGVGDDKRIITAFINSNQVTVYSDFSQNYSGVDSSSWAVFSKKEYYDNIGNVFTYTPDGGVIFLQDIYGQYIITREILVTAASRLKDVGLYLGLNNKITFSPSLDSNEAIDTGLFRQSAGLLQIYDGRTTTELRDLKLRSVQVTDNTAAASITTVGMTRYRADANGSYYEICMQTGLNTYAWVIIKQNTWS